MFTSRGYCCPDAGSDAAACIAHVSQLPRSEAPEVFGLHANAAISFNLQVGGACVLCVRVVCVLNLQGRRMCMGEGGEGGQARP